MSWDYRDKFATTEARPGDELADLTKAQLGARLGLDAKAIKRMRRPELLARVNALATSEATDA